MLNKSILKISLVGVVAIVAAFFATNVRSQDEANTIVLTSQNTLNLSAVVEGESVSELLHQAKNLSSKGTISRNSKNPVYLFLNTPGGNIQSGLELIEAVKGFDRPVSTITLFAASMGFQIAQNLGERLILQNGTLMSHRARGGFQGEFGGQHPSQVESRYAFWLDRLDEMDRTTVSRTAGKQTVASYQAAYASEMWLTGAKSVEKGYADRVVSIKCDKTLDGVSTHTTDFMGMPVQYDLDNCPINTAPTNIRMSIETTRGVMDTVEFVKQGGKFGPACLAYEKDALCAMDTSLNLSKIQDVKIKFVNKYNDNLRNVVYNYGVF